MYKTIMQLILCIVIVLGPFGYKKLMYDSDMIRVQSEAEVRSSYHSNRLGFDIYEPTVAKKLIDESRNLRIRYLQVADSYSAESNNTRINDRLWGLRMVPTSSRGVPKVIVVAKIIESMKLPDASLRNVKIFILPYALSGTSGLSYPDIVLLGSRPDGIESIDTQLEYTVAHEIGHILHYRYMGIKSGANWKEYMRLRKIAAWTDSGSAGSKEWVESVEETFAEDVRIILGNPRSSSEPLSTRYPDPRNDSSLYKKLSAFFMGIFNRENNDPRPVMTEVKKVFDEANSEYI